MKRTVLLFLEISIVAFFFGSCVLSKTASYDQESYKRTAEILAKSTLLMDKAGQPYEEHRQEAENLIELVGEMVIYEQNKPNNEVTLQMWKLLVDEDKSFLAGFIKEWKESKQLSETFRQEAKTQVIEAIELLLRFEREKDVQTKNNIKHLIQSNE
ncbi:hypothetical protein [Flagellimonas beolgyonensis]|uniref:hypothetical protein n=1 Tax=Flagellimonas beolgyonensis TaxID=864064 RepID=UPI003D64F2DB